MQGYRDKVYWGVREVGESDLFSAVRESVNLASSSCSSSDGHQLSISLSRGLPLTITTQKCTNCQKLQKCLTQLTTQLLAIEKDVLEKEQKLTRLLAEKTHSIGVLRERLEDRNEKVLSNHFGSTFCTEAELKQPTFPECLPRHSVHQSLSACSRAIQKKTAKLGSAAVSNFGVAPCQNRQKTQSKQSSQNVSPNSQFLGSEKRLSRLQFENEALKDYVASLTAQIERLKRPRH